MNIIKNWWNRRTNRERFDVQLVVIVFILTIIGAIISGVISSLLTYKFTEDKEPLVFVSLEGITNFHFLGMEIANYKDNPANNIKLAYKINEINESRLIFFSQHSSLFKEKPIKEGLNFSYVDKYIIDSLIYPKAEEYPAGLIHFYPENYEPFIKLGEYSNFKVIPEEFTIEFMAHCDNCKKNTIFVKPNKANYIIEIVCLKDNDIECKVINQKLTYLS